jgi:hypothetical protein
MLILSIFLDQKSPWYFPRKTLFNLTIFESPANGGGRRRLVIEALSSSGSGHIGPSPFFSLFALLTVADKPRAGG